MVPLPVMSHSPTLEKSIRIEMDRVLNAAVISSYQNQHQFNFCNSPEDVYKQIYANFLQSQKSFSHPMIQIQPNRDSAPFPEDYSSQTTVNRCLNDNDTSARLQFCSPDSETIKRMAPVLQLAVRRAISDCLAKLNLHVSIIGELDVLTDPNLKSANVDNVNLHFVNSKATNSSHTDHDSTIISTLVPSSQSISKRKCYQPHKYSSVDIITPNSNISTNVLSPYPDRIAEFPNGYVSAQFSGSTSPSTTDSGALDLSRGNSISGSAPITPMKVLSMKQDSIQYNKYSLYSQSDILEMYKNHLLTNGFLGQTAQEVPMDTSNHTEKNHVKNKRKRPQFVCSRTPSSPNLGRRNNLSRRFPCNQCENEFTSLHCLEDHTVAMHGSYRCHICRAQFTQRSNLQRHALKHVGFKPFECRVCRKAYYRKDHLMRHMEMGHPGFSPRDNITVHLTSSESLDFLNRSAIREQMLMEKEDESNDIVEINRELSPRDNNTVHLIPSESLNLLDGNAISEQLLTEKQEEPNATEERSSYDTGRLSSEKKIKISQDISIPSPSIENEILVDTVLDDCSFFCSE